MTQPDVPGLSCVKQSRAILAPNERGEQRQTANLPRSDSLLTIGVTEDDTYDIFLPLAFYFFTAKTMTKACRSKKNTSIRTMR